MSKKALLNADIKGALFSCNSNTFEGKWLNIFIAIWVKPFLTEVSFTDGKCNCFLLLVLWWAIQMGQQKETPRQTLCMECRVQKDWWEVWGSFHLTAIYLMHICLMSRRLQRRIAKYDITHLKNSRNRHQRRINTARHVTEFWTVDP
jgi:hypothetical protein